MIGSSTLPIIGLKTWISSAVSQGLERTKESLDCESTSLINENHNLRSTFPPTTDSPSPYDPVITIALRKPVSGSKVNATPLEAKSDLTIS